MGGVDRIHLAHDRYQWRAVVNTVMNLPLPDKWVKPGNLPTASGRVFAFYKQSVCRELQQLQQHLQHQFS